MIAKGRCIPSLDLSQTKGKRERSSQQNPTAERSTYLGNQFKTEFRKTLNRGKPKTVIIRLVYLTGALRQAILITTYSTTMETLSLSLENISSGIDGIEEANKVTKNLTGSTGWSDCPADILMIIFRNLDAKALLVCMEVNQWWCDVLDYLAQHDGLWDEIAQEGMWSRGVTFRRKSTPLASWRGLFLNSRLWLHVAAADLQLSYVLTVEDIQYLHVYKDVLIVIYGENLAKKFYSIGNSPCLEDTDINDTSISSKQSTPHTKVKESRRMIMKLKQEDSMKRLIVSGDNCYHTLDSKNVLRCSKFDESEEKWTEHTLARYYGCRKSISDIHIYNEDVYLLLRSGNVMRLDREGRNFEAALRVDQLLYRLMDYSRVIDTDTMKTCIDKVFSLKIPDYCTGYLVMFDNCSAAVSVPSDRKFKMSHDKDNNNMVLEYPDLTCATQHGDVLFLGFKSGKIEIVIPKKIVRNGGVPEVIINIQDFPDYAGHEPAIVALDVYEADQCHHLIIALRSHIYKLVISYPEKVKSLGLFCISFQ